MVTLTILSENEFCAILPEFFVHGNLYQVSTALKSHGISADQVKNLFVTLLAEKDGDSVYTCPRSVQEEVKIAA